MILYINVFITEHRNQGYSYNRYGLPWHNRLDIFKYSLVSLGALNKHWSKVIIYCKLDHPFSSLWSQLEPFVRGLFKGIKVDIYKDRNVSQKEWQTAYERDIMPVSDELIWYHGNDDHIFIDYNLNLIDQILEKMYTDPDAFKSCVYSHWPEYIRFAAHNHAWNNGCCAIFNSFNHDAIHIMSKKLFRHIFFDYQWGPLTRTDHIKFFIKLGTKCYVPYRELVRHFDGYSHSMDMPHSCPPLDIPPGFFKYNMKILYCSKERRKDWVNMNPVAPYRTADRHGVDCRYTLEEIPLFWRDRISEIEVGELWPKRALYNARNTEKLWITDPGLLFARRNMPVLPVEWMAPWMFLKPELPTLL